jgi:DNA-binding transcriptional LysR family regulator
MDRLESMAILIAAAEAGSLSAASRKLGVPLPTVSRKVAELERRLDAQLIVRSTRKLSLTDVGAAYVASSKRILEQVSEAEAAVAGEFQTPKGELVVTAPIAFGRLHVLPLICDFLSRYAEINIGLQLSDRTVNLADDHIDLAVRIGALPDSSLVAARVGCVRRVVCASPKFLATRGTPKTLEELSALPCVTFSGPSSANSWVFPARGRRAMRQLEITSRLQVNTAEAAVDAAIADVGLTHVLSYQAWTAVMKGQLRIVLKEFEPEALPVHLIHLRQAPMPQKTRTFLDFVVPKLRQSLTRNAAP